MYRTTDFDKEIYKVGEVAKFLGKSVKTIQNYDKQGILQFHRTSGDKRILFRSELIDYLRAHDMIKADDRKVLIVGDKMDKDEALSISNFYNNTQILIIGETGGIEDVFYLVAHDNVRLVVNINDTIDKVSKNYLLQVCKAVHADIKDTH